MSTYTGPSVPEMIANHSMAESFIKYHDGPSQNQILDDSELRILQRFVNNPQDRESILRDLGIDPNHPSSPYNNSLAGYIVLRHGRDDILTSQEIIRLREWFANESVYKQ